MTKGVTRSEGSETQYEANASVKGVQTGPGLRPAGYQRG